MSNLTRHIAPPQAIGSLRAIGVAIIVVHHIFRPDWLMMGMGIVAFFFVLSGFSLYERYGRDEHLCLRTYYTKRIRRILPLHVLTTLTLWLASPAIFTGSIWIYLLLLQCWFPTYEICYGGNSVAWFLSTLAFSYAVFPLLLGVVKRLSVCGTIFGIILITLCWIALNHITTDVFYRYTFPPTRVLDFALGMLWARLLQLKPKLPIHHANIVETGILVLTGAMIYAKLITPPEPNNSLYWAIPSSIIIIYFGSYPTNSGWLTRLLSWRLMSKLGHYAFAAYIQQAPVMFGVEHLLRFLGLTWQTSPLLPILGICTLWLSAAAWYHLSESIKFLR